MPACVLTDDLRAESLRTGRLPTNPTKEETQVFKVLMAWDRATQGQLHVASHGLPDIPCALPDEHVARTLRAKYGKSFPGWNRLMEKYKEAARENFKDFALRSLGLDTPAVKLLHEVLSESPAGPLPGTALDRSMREAIAALTESSSPTLRETE